VASSREPTPSPRKKVYSTRSSYTPSSRGGNYDVSSKNSKNTFPRTGVHVSKKDISTVE
jgi:hypothetical protein